MNGGRNYRRKSPANSERPGYPRREIFHRDGDFRYRARWRRWTIGQQGLSQSFLRGFARFYALAKRSHQARHRWLRNHQQIQRQRLNSVQQLCPRRWRRRLVGCLRV